MAQFARCLALAASRSGLLSNAGFALQALPSSSRLLGSVLGLQTGSPIGASPTHIASPASCLHTSTASQDAAPEVSKPKAPTTYEPARKYRSLADKELWHEAWMYEDRFGSEDAPIVVPSLESERIIGVTDPEDDNLVVWGILRDSEPARQFIEGGEFYVLKKVPYVTRVGDVLEQIEGGANPALK